MHKSNRSSKIIFEYIDSQDLVYDDIRNNLNCINVIDYYKHWYKFGWKFSSGLLIINFMMSETANNG